MATLTEFATLYRRREHLSLRTRLLFLVGAVAALHIAAVVLACGRFGDRRSAAGPGPGAHRLRGRRQTQLRLGPHRRHRQLDPEVRGPTQRTGQRRVRVQPGPQLCGDPCRDPGGGRHGAGGPVHGGRHHRKPCAGADRERRLRGVPAGHGPFQRVRVRTGRPGLPKRAGRPGNPGRRPRGQGIRRAGCWPNPCPASSGPGTFTSSDSFSGWDSTRPPPSGCWC